MVRQNITSSRRMRRMGALVTAGALMLTPLTALASEIVVDNPEVDEPDAGDASAVLSFEYSVETTLGDIVETILGSIVSEGVQYHYATREVETSDAAIEGTAPGTPLGADFQHVEGFFTLDVVDSVLGSTVIFTGPNGCVLEPLAMILVPVDEILDDLVRLVDVTVTCTIDVPVYGDNVYEGDEKFALDITDGIDEDVQTAFGTIKDNEVKPLLVIRDASFNEPDNGGEPNDNTQETGFFDVFLLEDISGRQILLENGTTTTWNSADDTADSPDDYLSITNDPVVFPPFTSAGTLGVTINGDNELEGTETFDVTGSASGEFVTISAPANEAVGTILDAETQLDVFVDLRGQDTPVGVDPDEVTTWVEIDDGEVAPDQLLFDVELTFNEGSVLSHNLAVTYTTREASAAELANINETGYHGASADVDYEVETTTVILPHDQSSIEIDATGIGDDLDEHNEAFVIEIIDIAADGAEQDAGGVPIGDANTIGDVIGVQNGVAFGIINDNDAMPTVSLTPLTASIGEQDAGERPLSFIAELSEASGRTVAVTVKTSDVTAEGGDDDTYDYRELEQRLVFSQGVTVNPFQVGVFGDTVLEDDETFNVKLSSPSSVTIANGAAVATIVDDDESQDIITIDDVDVVETDIGTVAELDVSITQAPGQDPHGEVTVNYQTQESGTAEEGVDYAPVSGTLTFPAGTDVQTIEVPIIGDRKIEDDEGFRVRLSKSTGGAVIATDRDGEVTIIDDDMEGDIFVDRVGGKTRIETSVLAAQKLRSADTVIIATSEDFPDALVGAPLADLMDAPVLLNPKAFLHDAIREELNRLAPEDVIILGGTSAISSFVEIAIEDLDHGPTVQRIFGTDRYGTARAIGERVGSSPDDEVIIASGLTFADALSSGSLRGVPILLTRPTSLPSSTITAIDNLEAERATIVGGTAAVSTSVQNALGTLGLGTTRLAGSDRYRTNAEILQEALNRNSDIRTFLGASGQNWPDALVAGGFIGRTNGMVVLLNPIALSDYNEVAVLSIRDRVAKEALILGGTAAISQSVASDVYTLLNEPLP